MAKEDDKFILRMPPGMRWLLKERAAQNRRSMNAEALLAIESWLAENDATGKVPTPPSLDETAAR